MKEHLTRTLHIADTVDTVALVQGESRSFYISSFSSIATPMKIYGTTFKASPYILASDLRLEDTIGYVCKQSLRIDIPSAGP